VAGSFAKLAIGLALVAVVVFGVFFFLRAAPERPRELGDMSGSELQIVFKQNYLADCPAGQASAERARCRCAADKIVAAHKPEELRKLIATPRYHELPQLQPFLEQCPPKQK
jgi:hypothetical protein